MLQIINNIPNDIIFMIFMAIFASVVSYINRDNNLFSTDDSKPKKNIKFIPHLLSSVFFCMCFYYALTITNLDFLVRACIASFISCLGFENILLLANKIINLINLYKGRKCD